MKKRADIVSLRAIAIIFVALGHSIIIYSSDWSLYKTAVECTFLDHLKDVINVIQMPLFFSISGFCLIYTMRKSNPISMFIIDKIRRILIPFLIIGVFWLYPIRLISKYPPYYDKNLFSVIFYDIILGKDNGHLWFLPTLFFMLLITYCIGVWTKFNPDMHTRNTIYFYALIILIAVATMALPFNLPYLDQFGQYYIFFVVGILIHQYDYLVARNSLAILFSTIVMITAFAAIWMGLDKLIMTKAVSLLCTLYAYYVIPNSTNKILSHLSKNSMGIYLFHSPLVYLSYCFYPNISPWLMVLINFVGFGGIAYLLTSACRKAHLGFIIGE